MFAYAQEAAARGLRAPGWTPHAAEKAYRYYRLEVWSRAGGEKASIAVDGISLTVAETDGRGATFRIAVIPHTWTSTTLQERTPGDAVNLEADLLAKYTERLMGWRQADAAPAISRAWLAEHGWG